MLSRLLLGYEPFIQLVLHEGMVLSDLPEFAISEQICSAITDMGNNIAVVKEGNQLSSTAHPLVTGICRCLGQDLLITMAENLLNHCICFAFGLRQLLAENLLGSINKDPAGDFS